jgi:hypothetical protein
LTYFRNWSSAQRNLKNLGVGAIDSLADAANMPHVCERGMFASIPISVLRRDNAIVSSWPA